MFYIARRLLNMFYLGTKKEIGKKLFLLTVILIIYLRHKSNKRSFKRVFQKTKRNINLMNSLIPLMNEFKPTFYLPTALLQIIIGNGFKRFNFSFRNDRILMPDGGSCTIEWFPQNHDSLVYNTPIIIFLPGAVGSTSESYIHELAYIIKKKGWRLAIANRRGFGNSELDSTIFMHKEEPLDLVTVTNHISDKFPLANQYLMGVSAGANFGTLFLGLINERTSIKAYCSISNPFNIGRISFNMKSDQYNRLFSKIIARNFKDLYRKHSRNKNFREMLKKHELCPNKLTQKIDKIKTCWEIDKLLISKINGWENVYDYYSNVASEYVLEDITIPTLFINSKEDPVCLKQYIPVDKIYQNKNTMLILTERGGHIEYLSGWKMDWWAFEMGLKYFDQFEKE